MIKYLNLLYYWFIVEFGFCGTMKIESSLFLDFFGNYPLIRIFDFLIENDSFDYSKKDICKNARVSWNTLETFWAKLGKKGIVVSTRKVGKAGMYKINKKNQWFL